MNIQDYISSGILETYVLGECSPEERESVEKALLQYPELREELARIESSLEAFAMKASVQPRDVVKQNILAQLSGSNERGKVVSMVSTEQTSSVAVWKYVAAASVAIALAASYMAYDYRTRWIEKEIAFNELSARNQQVAEDYNVVHQKLDKIQGDLSIIENSAFRKVVLKGTPAAANALASVYWNESSKEVYISIQNLKGLAKDNQYQLWAIVDGKPVDAGVFDKNFSGLLKMKNISGAVAFAVTIEPRGGLASPTLSTMQVVGAIPVEKS